MKRIYLCQPYSYTIEPEAQEARILALEGHDGFDCYAPRICSSGLCEAFNTGVAYAKNSNYDYFAMLHSDVSAEPGWLGILIGALEESGADIINAAACIKDNRGLTSTALAYSPDIHAWKRKLTLTELYKLPDVFTLADVHQVIDPDATILLPNPGCFVCKMGPWFYEWPGFHTFNDVRPNADGVYKSRFISEDYMLGYYASEHGVKVAGTRRVATTHWGRKGYSTDSPWGLDCDRGYFQGIGKPQVAKGRWVFPTEIEGWLTAKEGVGLAKLAMERRVLEIGSFQGKSTICMAQTAKHVTAIDPHDGRATTKPGGTLDKMLANLATYQAANVTVHQSTSAEFAASYAGEKFDLVFIDGDHSHEAVQQDIAIAQSLLADDGVIAFHDYRITPGEHDGGWDEGVTQAINEWILDGAELLDRQGTVAVMRPPSLVEAM